MCQQLFYSFFTQIMLYLQILNITDQFISCHQNMGWNISKSIQDPRSEFIQLNSCQQQFKKESFLKSIQYNVLNRYQFLVGIPISHLTPMDPTNISRYQNPPEQAEYSALSHLNSKEDYLDVFIIGLLHRSPIIYVLINITLLIWLAQTIISSKIEEIPKSAYLISPYFGQYPFKDISVTSEENCPEKWQKLMLRNFPTVFSESFNHKQMSQWGVDGNMTFCAQRVSPTLSKFQDDGTCKQTFNLCNGYCFENEKQCPITSINALIADDSGIGKNRRIFYSTSDGTQYTQSKKQGRPIISLIATFRHRCSNDYHYMDRFDNLTEYEKVLGNCGPEGTINSFYDKVTEMKTQTFMYYNNRPFKPQDSNLQEIELGAIHQIDFNNDIYGECYTVRQKARKASEYLFNDPVEPMFTQSLLVIGFILMIAQIIWLMIYVCVNGYFHEKNIIVILICVIELTVISFIYSENAKIFDTQEFIRSIASCIETQVTAASTWNFGIQSSSAFTMIQYVGTIFLAHYVFAYFMDKLIFQPSSEIYRNFVYDDSNDRSPVVQFDVISRA